MYNNDVQHCFTRGMIGTYHFNMWLQLFANNVFFLFYFSIEEVSYDNHLLNGFTIL